MQQPPPPNVNHVLGAHFMAAEAADAVFIVDHRLPVPNLDGVLGAAFRTLAAAHALCFADLRGGGGQFFWPPAAARLGSRSIKSVLEASAFRKSGWARGAIPLLHQAGTPPGRGAPGPGGGPPSASGRSPAAMPMRDVRAHVQGIGAFAGPQHPQLPEAGRRWGRCPPWPGCRPQCTGPGFKKSHRSTSISEKGCFSGNRQWSSGFCSPGTAPNRFFTAPEKPTMAVGFQLAQVDEVVPGEKGLRHRELAAPLGPGQGDLPAFALLCTGQSRSPWPCPCSRSPGRWPSWRRGYRGPPGLSAMSTSAPGLLHALAHRGHQGRVGGNGGVRLGADHQVGLDAPRSCRGGFPPKFPRR